LKENAGGEKVEVEEKEKGKREHNAGEEEK
jgi:hypothetical protein